MAKVFSESAQAVLAHLQANEGAQETFKDIAAATGVPVKSMTGVLNGLARKGLVVRTVVEGVDGKVIELTATGRAVDPDADKEEPAE